MPHHSNLDGEFDVFTIFKDGNIFSQEKDTNFDGKIDYFSRFDPKGLLKEIKENTRYTGQIDRLRFFEKGIPLRMEYDADGDGYLRNNRMERKDGSIYLSYFFPDEGKIKLGMRFNEGEYGMVVENLKGSPFYDNDYPESEGDRLVGPGIRWQGGTTHGDGSYYWKERYEWDLIVEKSLLGIAWEARSYLNDEDRTDYIYERASGDLALVRNCPSDYSWGWSLRGAQPSQIMP